MAHPIPAQQSMAELALSEAERLHAIQIQQPDFARRHWGIDALIKHLCWGSMRGLGTDEQPVEWYRRMFGLLEQGKRIQPPVSLQIEG